jgi:glycosyltransferase involved in cell wall biosynthesis
MVIEKGILNLLSSWSLVYESLPDYELHIYGDGPLSSAVLRIIQDSNLTERTIIHGEVSRDEIKEALISAEILIQPSLIPEAFGLSVLEAMSAGLPCIVTNKGALPELIQNDFNGLVVPPNHAAELAVAISRLASDTDLRKRLGASAKRKVRESFSSELIMTRYEELFESLI